MNSTAATSAALSSITALQNRIKALENENCVLKEEYEFLAKQLQDQSSSFNTREFTLTEATEKARSMLKSTTDLTSQMFKERSRNRFLKNQIAESEILLTKQKQKAELNKQAYEEMQNELNVLIQKNADSEALFGQILSPPPLSTYLSQDEALVVISKDVTQETLTPQLFELYQSMVNLPKSFHFQTIDKKREMIKIISDAKYEAVRLLAQIRQFEKKKFASSTPKKVEMDLKKLASQECVIANQIQQFKFT